MKIKVIKEFIDRENDMTHRKIGETFEVWSRHAVSLRLKTNVSYIAVGEGFSAKTATLLSLCDISPNRQCRQLKKIRKNNAQIRQQKLVQKAN